MEIKKSPPTLAEVYQWNVETEVIRQYISDRAKNITHEKAMQNMATNHDNVSNSIFTKMNLEIGDPEIENAKNDSLKNLNQNFKPKADAAHQKIEKGWQGPQTKSDFRVGGNGVLFSFDMTFNGFYKTSLSNSKQDQILRRLLLEQYKKRNQHITDHHTTMEYDFLKKFTYQEKRGAVTELVKKVETQVAFRLDKSNNKALTEDLSKDIQAQVRVQAVKEMILVSNQSKTNGLSPSVEKAKKIARDTNDSQLGHIVQEYNDQMIKAQRGIILTEKHKLRVIQVTLERTYADGNTVKLTEQDRLRIASEAKLLVKGISPAHDQVEVQDLAYLQKVHLELKTANMNVKAEQERESKTKMQAAVIEKTIEEQQLLIDEHKQRVEKLRIITLAGKEAIEKNRDHLKEKGMLTPTLNESLYLQEKSYDKELKKCDALTKGAEIMASNLGKPEGDLKGKDKEGLFDIDKIQKANKLLESKVKTMQMNLRGDNTLSMNAELIIRRNASRLASSKETGREKVVQEKEMTKENSLEI